MYTWYITFQIPHSLSRCRCIRYIASVRRRLERVDKVNSTLSPNMAWSIWQAANMAWSPGIGWSAIIPWVNDLLTTPLPLPRDSTRYALSCGIYLKAVVSSLQEIEVSNTLVHGDFHYFITGDQCFFDIIGKITIYSAFKVKKSFNSFKIFASAAFSDNSIL